MLIISCINVNYYHLQIPLGILHQNENKLDEMTMIMDHIQQYMPSRSIHTSRTLPNSETFNEDKQYLHRILFGGDQLTVARTRGGIAIRQDHNFAEQKLDGLLPTIEDWHAKQCFLKVCSFSYYVTW